MNVFNHLTEEMKQDVLTHEKRRGSVEAMNQARKSQAEQRQRIYDIHKAGGYSFEEQFHSVEFSQTPYYELPQQFFMVYNNIFEVTQAFGLSITESWCYLYCIRNVNGANTTNKAVISKRKLAKAVGISDKTAGTVLNRLVTLGFLDRTENTEETDLSKRYQYFVNYAYMMKFVVQSHNGELDTDKRQGFKIDSPVMNDVIGSSNIVDSPKWGLDSDYLPYLIEE